MESLASMAGLDLCGGTMRKQILRILTTLSLYDGNWTGLLLELSKVGTRLSLDATDELSGTHKLLKGVSEVKGDAAYAMSLPELSVPSSVSELRLLQVLRLLTSLRPDLKGRRENPKL